MKTNVQIFCQDFSSELDPFADRLDQALDTLSRQQDLPQLNGTVMSLREVRQRLATLQDKISGQQAFLLIFGPLKSGKSTLMNAISGAYVSEVSSLPAYPALVYVKHGEERRFEATTYAGETRRFPDNLAMTEAVQNDHTRLATAILEVERAGDDFDPRQHYPEAIRRMDIELPAPELAESGTVLVDTPGLYSRMKFGYDQMTRDFRDTAACAIFVVKTDNLFFEKVFEEFEELLSCFTRIFLVSNIDTSKRDLKPDGSLEASLESRDPDKVIEAFRSLSMSATLRQAIDEGRLNIYSIDLLKAASQRLGGTESLDQEAGDGFERFLGDLTGYLNSSDYLNDFMRDSLRLAEDLTREAAGLVGSDAASELRRSSQQLREKLDRDRDQLSALEQLERLNSTAAFEHLYDERDQQLQDLSGKLGRQLEESLQQTVDEWMQSDDSWNSLIAQLNGRLEQESREDGETILARLRSLLENDQGGARFSPEQQDTFRRAGLRVAELVPPLLTGLGGEVDAPLPRLDLAAENVPLRRGLSDGLLFRSNKQIRIQLFGPEGEQAIPAARKEKRLQPEGSDYIKERATQAVGEQLPARQQAYATQVLDSYIAAFGQALEQRVAAQKTDLNRAVEDTRRKLDLREQALGVLEDIETGTNRFGGLVTELQVRYGVASIEEDEQDELNGQNGLDDGPDGLDGEQEDASLALGDGPAGELNAEDSGSSGDQEQSDEEQVAASDYLPDDEHDKRSL